MVFLSQKRTVRGHPSIGQYVIDMVIEEVCNLLEEPEI